MTHKVSAIGQENTHKSYFGTLTNKFEEKAKKGMGYVDAAAAAASAALPTLLNGTGGVNTCATKF